MLIFDVWRSALQLFTVWNRQELVTYGGKPSGISNLRWETVSSWPGRARLDWLRATGPHEPSWPDYRRTFYIYIANRKCCLWGIRSLSWHSEPLSSWRRTVTYDSPPSVWISPLITVMWRRRHLNTVIYGAISDWRRKFTTLIWIHVLSALVWVELNSFRTYKHLYTRVQCFGLSRAEFVSYIQAFESVLWSLRLTPSTVIWRSGVIYGFNRQKLITRRNLRWC